MRIAQVAPLYESVPPRFYGGTERIVHFLTEELVRNGHDVTLFASGDSETSAKLSVERERSLRLDDRPSDELAPHIAMIEHVAKRRREFDIVHFHIGFLHFPVSRRMRLPTLTTLHGRLDTPDLSPLFAEFPEMPLVSISDNQRLPLPKANWLRTVPHGLPTDLFPFTEKPAGYFAFLGRISHEKRVDRAIRIATTVGVPIRIAAKIDKCDREYFKEHVAALFRHPLVEYVGEIGESEKSEFLGNARALLFPVDWPEPFGLVMIEAMACGTPVIAFENGSVPEVIDNGVTGFVVTNMQQAIRAARQVGDLSRAKVRRTFERRFSARRMALEYVELYEKIAEVPPSNIAVERAPAA
jgi:glycosyltransferase involved in cell wall biosynthesis